MTAHRSAALEAPPIVFLDTEFTGLAEPYLISVGMVSEGRELYVELAGISEQICSAFVREAVLPHLNGCGLPPIDAAARIAEFLARCGESVVLFCDAPRYDIELLRPFIPARLRWSYAVPSLDNAEEERAFDAAKEQAFAEGLRRHHALDDARAMSVAWTALHPSNPRPTAHPVC